MVININKKLFDLYSFLFIYTMINREFLLFGLDLRFVVLLLGIILIILKITNLNSFLHNTTNVNINNNINRSDKIYGCLFILFVWSLISNISWIWNGLDIFPTQILNQNILILNNLIAITVYKKYKKYINEEKIKKEIIFSCIVLVTSFVLTGMGYSLSQISGSDVRSMVQASAGAAEHKNIYGGSFRIAGYAEDPNYASVFLVLGAITAVQINWKKAIKYFFAIVFLVAFGFSCSKTILLSFFLGGFYLFCIGIFKKQGFSKILNCLCTIIISSTIVILPNSGLLASHSTMATRFKMWNMARDIFLNSPIIGNGINSFKSYINSMYSGTWYVQPHSTYWQLLSETGIIGFMIFVVLMIRCLNNKSLSKYNKYLVFIFFIFVINFETLQLQIFVYIVYILSLFNDNKNEVDYEK